MFSQNNISNREFYKPYLNIMRYFRITGIDLFGERLWTLPVFKHMYLVIYLGYVLGMVSHATETVLQMKNGADMVPLSANLSNVALMIQVSYTYDSMADKNQLTVMFFIQGCILYLHVFMKRDKIKTVVMKIAKLWPSNGSLSDEMINLKDKKLKALNTTTYAYFSCLNFFIQIYLTAPFIITCFRKFILKQNTEHMLTFWLNFPLDYKNNFGYYVLVFFLQYFIELNYVFLQNSDLLIMTVTVGHLQTLFLLLQDKLKQMCNQKIVNQEQYNEVEKQLMINVKRHAILLELPNEIGSAFGGVFAINLVFLPVSICFFGFAARVTGSLETLGHLCVSFLRSGYLYLCCLYGQRVADSSLEISSALYDSVWYECPQKIKKSVIVIMLRSQHTKYVTSTSFVKISLPTFTKVMNLTWSLLSLMTTKYG